MELTRLKKRLATATRGHKLPKDKQDELMRRFIENIRKNKELRLQVENELEDALREFLLASAVMSPEFMGTSSFISKGNITVDIKKKT